MEPDSLLRYMKKKNVFKFVQYTYKICISFSSLTLRSLWARAHFQTRVIHRGASLHFFFFYYCTVRSWWWYRAAAARGEPPCHPVVVVYLYSTYIQNLHFVTLREWVHRVRIVHQFLFLISSLYKKFVAHCTCVDTHFIVCSSCCFFFLFSMYSGGQPNLFLLKWYILFSVR